MTSTARKNTGTIRRVACFAVAGAVALGTAGCAAGSQAASAGSSNQATTAAATTSTWTATADDNLAILTVQVAGGNVVAMPGDGWAPRDGYIQLQLSGSSIGGQEIDGVTQNGDALTVKLKSAGDGPATLDLVATEYRLEGGDATSVKSVAVTYADGQTTQLEQAYE